MYSRSASGDSSLALGRWGSPLLPLDAFSSTSDTGLSARGSSMTSQVLKVAGGCSGNKAIVADDTVVGRVEAALKSTAVTSACDSGAGWLVFLSDEG